MLYFCLICSKLKNLHTCLNEKSACRVILFCRKLVIFLFTIIQKTENSKKITFNKKFRNVKFLYFSSFLNFGTINFVSLVYPLFPLDNLTAAKNHKFISKKERNRKLGITAGYLVIITQSLKNILCGISFK